MKDITVVGYVYCPGCPMKIRLFNDEGVEGLPANDRLESHNYHGTTDQCRACNYKYKSRREQGKFLQDEPPRTSLCDHLQLARGGVFAGQSLSQYE